MPMRSPQSLNRIGNQQKQNGLHQSTDQNQQLKQHLPEIMPTKFTGKGSSNSGPNSHSTTKQVDP